MKDRVSLAKIFFVIVLILGILMLVPMWPVEYKTFPYVRKDLSEAWGIKRFDPAKREWQAIIYGADTEAEAQKWIKQQIQHVPGCIVISGIFISEK